MSVPGKVVWILSCLSALSLACVVVRILQTWSLSLGLESDLGACGHVCQNVSSQIFT